MGRVGAEALALLHLFDVHVPEAEDPNGGQEPSGSVHVPDPGVVEEDLEVDGAVAFLFAYVDGVGEVISPLFFLRTRFLRHI